MKITVCQLRNDSHGLEADWERLVRHVRSQASDLVLLPEMPFFPWIASTPYYDGQVWQASVEAHESWVSRFQEIAPALVLGARPINQGIERFNEAYIWDVERGVTGCHTKHYLPADEGFWEMNWYDRGPDEFIPVNTPFGKLGFLICTELWITKHAIAYAREGVRVIACPRATEMASLDKWKVGGRAAAVLSGAFCVSSNLAGRGEHGIEWGGSGWIIEPEEGAVLGLTSGEKPFLTMEIDLRMADEAKRSYPRYIYT